MTLATASSMVYSSLPAASIAGGGLVGELSMCQHCPDLVRRAEVIVLSVPGT